MTYPAMTRLLLEEFFVTGRRPMLLSQARSQIVQTFQAGFGTIPPVDGSKSPRIDHILTDSSTETGVAPANLSVNSVLSVV